MLSTKDYSLFKHIEKNRDIESSNFKSLLRSIKQKNLLHMRPITVNEKMEVIDGQHRLEVAKHLGVEIFYNIEKKAKEEDMYLLNSAQALWSNEAYLNYFVKSGNTNYIRFKEFMVTNKIKLSLTNFLLGETKKDCRRYEGFRKGEFIYPSEEKVSTSIQRLANVERMSRFVREKTGDARPLASVSFVRAVIYLQNLEEVDFDDFMLKLELNLPKFRRCAAFRDWLQMLIEIHNFRNRSSYVDPTRVVRGARA